MDYYPNNLKGLKMNIKIFILSSGDYGSRIINNIANRGFASDIVGLHEFPEIFPNLSMILISTYLKIYQNAILYSQWDLKEI